MARVPLSVRNPIIFRLAAIALIIIILLGLVFVQLRSNSRRILVYDKNAGGKLYECLCSSGSGGDAGWRWRPIPPTKQIPGISDLCPDISLPKCP